MSEEVKEAEVAEVDDLANDLGIEKETLAKLIKPIPAGFYMAIFQGLTLCKNGEKVGFVHPTKSGGKKVMPKFQVQKPGDEYVNNRYLPSPHVAVGYKLFAQLDAALDIVTGKAIDPKKVEAAISKVVTLKVGIDEEYNPDRPRNTVDAIYPYRALAEPTPAVEEEKVPF